MDQFWDKIVLDNTIRDYAIVATIILVAYLLKKYVGRYTASVFFWLMNRMGRLIERKAFIELILSPAEIFLFLLISFQALQTLTFPKVFLYSFHKTDTAAVLSDIASAILILAFFSMLLRVVDYITLVMEKRADITEGQEDNQLVVFLKDFLKVILVIIGILTMLKFVFNQNISNLLAGLSIVGAAIALAARESIENLIASFIIFFDKPFTTGDMLKVNNVTGIVERIGLRSTRIRTTEKTYVTVPNKQMVDSIVDNLSLRTHRRGELRLEVDLKTNSTDIEMFLAGIKKILQHKYITDSTVFLSDISPQSYIITVEYLSVSVGIQEFNQMKQDINFGIMKLVENSNVELKGTDHEIRITRDRPYLHDEKPL
jgi:MscS family membrane protein